MLMTTARRRDGSIWHWLTALILAVTSSSCFSQPAIVDIANPSQLGVILSYESLEDPSAKLTIHQVRNRAGWRSVNGLSPNFGFTNSSFWIRVTLGNSSGQAEDVVVDLKTSLQDYVNWYVIDRNRNELKAEVQSGDRRQFDYRHQGNYTLSLPLTVPAGEDLTVYLNITSHDGYLESFPLSLLAPQDFITERSREKSYLGMYFGSLLAFSVCSLFLFALTKEQIYLLFSLFLFSTMCSNFVYYGVSGELLLKEFPGINNGLLPFFLATGGGFFFLFARKFLKLADCTPVVVMKIYDVVTSVLLATAIWFSITSYAIAYAIICNIILLNIFLLTVLGIWMCLRKDANALVFLFAFLPMGLALSLKILSIDNVFTIQYLLERNFFLAQTTLFAIVALGFSLSLSIGKLRADMHDARARELERATALRNSERKMFHLARVSMAGELTGAVVHELSQPLSSILTNSQASEMMIKGGRFDQKEHLAIMLDITHQAKVATAVISRVRSLLSPGTQAMDKIYVPKLYATVQNLLRHDFAQKKIFVHETCEPGLYVRGDVIQLQQVIVNLLMNAIDALQDLPPPQRTITLTARRLDAQYALMSVTDMGCGFPSTLDEEIFSAFFTTKQNGLGLGLNICKKIVAAHGGTIRARSLVPVGSVVEFTVPVDV